MLVGEKYRKELHYGVDESMMQYAVLTELTDRGVRGRGKGGVTAGLLPAARGGAVGSGVVGWEARAARWGVDVSTVSKRRLAGGR
jgi:hypothetical protein